MQAARLTLEYEVQRRREAELSPIRDGRSYMERMATEFLKPERARECFAIIRGEPVHQVLTDGDGESWRGPKTVPDWRHLDVPIPMPGGAVKMVCPDEFEALKHSYKGSIEETGPREVRDPLEWLRSRHPDLSELLEAAEEARPGTISELFDEADRVVDRQYASLLKRRPGFIDEVEAMASSLEDVDWDAFKLICHGEGHEAARVILKIVQRAPIERRASLARELARSIYPDLCKRWRALRENTIYQLDRQRAFGAAVETFIKGRKS